MSDMTEDTAPAEAAMEEGQSTDSSEDTGPAEAVLKEGNVSDSQEENGSDSVPSEISVELSGSGSLEESRGQTQTVRQRHQAADKEGSSEAEETPDDDEEKNKSKEFRETHQLSEDVYSLIFVLRFRSGGFIFAIFVTAFQGIIIALILWDLLNKNYAVDPNNLLKVPPGVSLPVRVAEAFALVLAVATQKDVIEALVKLQNGFDEGLLTETKYYATCFKWFLSSLLQFCVGAGLLLVIFILVMQSSTVINMMLNFAALSFVSEIDDVAFALAKNGFISDRLQKETKHVSELKVPARPSSNRFRRLAFFAVLCALMAYYGVIVSRQNKGDFTCQSIFVQFGDEFEPAISTFSGVYDRTNHFIGERSTYVGRADPRTMFGYCLSEGAWAFTLWDDDLFNIEGDPCNWFALSPRTETFDITETTDSSWQAYRLSVNNTNGPAPFERFYLTCMDCGGSSTRRGRCSDKGECVNNKCQCDVGRYGLNCEFTAPCSKLVVDARTRSFPREAGVQVSNEYELLFDENDEMVMVYNRPVYVYDHGSAWSIMLFSGRRWLVMNTELEFLVNSTGSAGLNHSRTELAALLEGFHGYYTEGYLALFISDPMDVGAPTDDFTPVGLQWNRVKTNSIQKWYSSKIGSLQALGTAQLCAICDTADNYCFGYNTCGADGKCNCTAGYQGALCELDTTGT